MSLWRVCRKAGVDYSRVVRWRSGQNSPNVNTLERYVGLLDAQMQAIEQDVAAKLAARVPQTTAVQ